VLTGSGSVAPIPRVSAVEQPTDFEKRVSGSHGGGDSNIVGY
jgi:hypothetical protein